MARRKRSATEGTGLFEQFERDERRRIRQHKSLFINRFLREAAANAQLRGPSQDRAYEIALRWADLESSGHLAKHRETSIDTQFLDQFFGEGLGYHLKTEHPDTWQLEHKFSVAGVGIADGAIGNFPARSAPVAIIELKDALTDLDRDRTAGRTAVQQCWDYLNAVPDCPWGIVSNFVTLRLYHRTAGNQVFEEFTLQELRERERFDEFYALFERGGFLPSRLMQKPRALSLLEKTRTRQKEVGDRLYESYRTQRLRLIDHLMHAHGHPQDDAIRIAQKLLDRVIFIAFCEDRELLPENSLAMACSDVAPFARAANPRWRNFLDLFVAVDKGANGKRQIPAYNGGLFAHDPLVDTLDLDDEPWTRSLAGFGEYDFSDEVNVEVLGHLFERSITELERLRVGGLFALKGAMARSGDEPLVTEKPARSKAALMPAGESDAPPTKMPKSAQRKRFGIYYTPPAFTSLIVERTVDALIRERLVALAAHHGVNPDSREEQSAAKLLSYWQACLDELQSVTVCDPACGSGAFLIRAYDSLDGFYKTVIRGMAGSGLPRKQADALESSIPDLILNHNLYGVDLSKEGVEITQLALWIRSARRGKTLADLSRHVVHGNSLVADPGVDPRALDWKTVFPHVFGKGGPGGFSCIIGNPPWERVKVQDREFFSLTDPDTAEAVSAEQRKKRITAMPKANPELHRAYLTARDAAQKMLDYARGSDRYPLTGKGDVNLYMLFAELARSLVAPDGLAGLLLPSGIATDDTTKEYFNDLMDSGRLVSLYDFENKEGHFEDVHRSFKFTALIFGGAKRKAAKADFVFFARGVEETAASQQHRHVSLTAADMALLNPNTRTCPIFRTRRDADITRAIYKRVPILVDKNRKKGGNPWGIKFFRMFDQTNDAEHFRDAAYWEKQKFKLSGNTFVRGQKKALPLYEAKMVQAYDHRAASVLIDEGNWVRQGQKSETTSVEHQNPEFCAQPRWWVDESTAEAALENQPGENEWHLGFKDITSPTNERTMIASFVPHCAATNKFVLMLTDMQARSVCCLLANLNSFALDYVTRQKIGGITLNFFIVEQLPILPPDTYRDKCLWSKRESLEHWISERVLKLSCTADDMIPLAAACGFKGSRGDGVHTWKESERAVLRAELDAAYFILYGIRREDVEYILSTFTNTGFIAEEDRTSGEPAWRRDGTGQMVLDAYDHFTGLEAAR